MTLKRPGWRVTEFARFARCRSSPGPPQFVRRSVAHEAQLTEELSKPRVGDLHQLPVHEEGMERRRAAGRVHLDHSDDALSVGIELAGRADASGLLEFLDPTGDPSSGDFSDARLIRKFGDVPDDLSAL
jgi:hypothetical protein